MYAWEITKGLPVYILSFPPIRNIEKKEMTLFYRAASAHAAGVHFRQRRQLIYHPSSTRTGAPIILYCHRHMLVGMKNFNVSFSRVFGRRQAALRCFVDMILRALPASSLA